MDYDELVRQGKVKRVFRAKRKLTMPDLVSHITQRAVGKEPLFLEESDYLFMLEDLKDISQKRSLDNDLNTPCSFLKPGFVLGLLANDDCRQKKIYRNLLRKGVPLGKEDVIEQTNAILKLQKALVRIFPSVFSGIEKSKQISQHTGIDLPDEEQLERRITEMKAAFSTISPDSQKGRRFLIEQLIARGYKRYEIADRLGISIKTVYNTLKAQSE